MLQGTLLLDFFHNINEPPNSKESLFQMLKIDFQTI